jgi:hypothetical protein
MTDYRKWDNIDTDSDTETSVIASTGATLFPSKEPGRKLESRDEFIERHVGEGKQFKDLDDFNASCQAAKEYSKDATANKSCQQCLKSEGKMMKCGAW